MRAVCAATTTQQECDVMCSHPCTEENDEKKLKIKLHYHGSTGYGPDERYEDILPRFVCAYDNVLLSLNPRPQIVVLCVFVAYLVFLIVLLTAIPTYYCSKRRWKCSCKRGVNVFTEKMFAERKSEEPTK